MLITIDVKHKPATDIGFLLHKNPNKMHSFPMSFGDAYVFYPEITEEKCTVALLINVDPIKLVRKGNTVGSFALAKYVNDRPYVCSSFMSVALNKAFHSLLLGKSKHRPELVSTPLALEVKITSIRCDDGSEAIKKIFEPLAYEVHTTNHILDAKLQNLGNSSYYTVTLKATCTLRDLITHLYVLLPVLDNNKHYYIDNDEIEKLIRFGEGWLENHPEKEMITYRYLKFKSFAKEALSILNEENGLNSTQDESTFHSTNDETEYELEKKISLNDHRINCIIETLKVYKAKRILDMGCGDGKLLKQLLEDNYFEHLTGCDVSSGALKHAHKNLNIDKLPPFKSKRLSLIQTALTYQDKRLTEYDAATIIEVIEHLDPHRLETFRRVVFELSRPQIIIMTTPNSEYNILFENLADGKLRHNDHRFEWTRKEFECWAHNAANDFGYEVHFKPIGNIDKKYGSPTQMGVFVKKS